MKVLDLLEEIEEVVDTAAAVPLTGKIMVDADEILEIVKEIRIELPDEIQQAQWIKEERERILSEAKQEYETVLKDARRQAEALIENDDITVKAKQRAEEILTVAQNNVRELKMSAFNYIDSILYNFQQKMDQLNGEHFIKMFEDIETTFGNINDTLGENRKEIEELAQKTQAEHD
jgi:DNA anti-recombination protein RmuC